MNDPVYELYITLDIALPIMMWWIWRKIFNKNTLCNKQVSYFVEAEAHDADNLNRSLHCIYGLIHKKIEWKHVEAVNTEWSWSWMGSPRWVCLYSPYLWCTLCFNCDSLAHLFALLKVTISHWINTFRI